MTVKQVARTLVRAENIAENDYNENSHYNKMITRYVKYNVIRLPYAVALNSEMKY